MNTLAFLFSALAAFAFPAATYADRLPYQTSTAFTEVPELRAACEWVMESPGHCPDRTVAWGERVDKFLAKSGDSIGLYIHNVLFFLREPLRPGTILVTSSPDLPPIGRALTIAHEYGHSIFNRSRRFLRTPYRERDQPLIRSVGGEFSRGEERYLAQATEEFAWRFQLLVYQLHHPGAPFEDLWSDDEGPSSNSKFRPYFQELWDRNAVDLGATR